MLHFYHFIANKFKLNCTGFCLYNLTSHFFLVYTHTSMSATQQIEFHQISFIFVGFMQNSSIEFLR